jgi:arginine exporter protein ArgO
LNATTFIGDRIPYGEPELYRFSSLLDTNGFFYHPSPNARSTMSALLDGLLAGYGIAIPFGGISMLIINMALERGFRLGLVAGMGTATVDLLCAALAVFAGAAAMAIISPYSGPLQMLSGLVLVAMGAYGLLRHRRRRAESPQEEERREEGLITYAKFIGLTVLNPFTVAYFLALIVGKGPSWSFSFADCLWFVTGVAVASCSWQVVLAGLGALARKHLTPRFMTATVLIGNAIVILLGAQILLTL